MADETARATWLKPLEWGFPLTLSRNTDIPAFWMKRFFQWLDRGYIDAPHPQTGMPARWSLDPRDVHSLFWYSKDYRRFLKHPRRAELDANYRQYFAMTICGDRTTELRVPELDVQLQCFADMVAEYGVEKMQWRYSPVPNDWSEFERVAKFMADLGVTECYFSFLHSETAIPETRSWEQRRDIVERLCAILKPLGITLLGCWDDDSFAGVAENFGKAVCVDAYRIDRIYGIHEYGLMHPTTDECRCSASIEVATQNLLACPHACTYCYAAPQNIGRWREMREEARKET